MRLTVKVQVRMIRTMPLGEAAEIEWREETIDLGIAGVSFAGSGAQAVMRGVGGRLTAEATEALQKRVLP